MSKFLMMNLFPINFGVVNFGEESRDLNAQILKEVFRLKKEIEPIKRSGRGGVFQTPSNLETKYEFFSHLREYFAQHSVAFLQQSGFTGDLWEYLDVADFWFNYNNNPNAYHLPHQHGNGKTLFSGVYFPTSGILDGEHLSKEQNLDDDPIVDFTNRPDPGSLVMLDPNFALKRAVVTNKQTYYPYYGNSLAITPREGVLVLFPAYLMHMVVPTEKENFERLSIVFNINKRY